jgi:hypothetical protein
LDDVGRRRSALRSSRRRRAAAGQGACARAPQGRTRAALKGVRHEVPLARTPRKSAAAPWPCPPWTLSTAGVWARTGFRGPTAGAGGLDLVGWAESSVGCSLLGSSELGWRIKGAATDFVCWADSSHGPKMGKGKGKRKRFLFIFRNYFRGRNNLENS